MTGKGSCPESALSLERSCRPEREASMRASSAIMPEPEGGLELSETVPIAVAATSDEKGSAASSSAASASAATSSATTGPGAAVEGLLVGETTDAAAPRSFLALLCVVWWQVVYYVTKYRPPDRAKLAEIAAVNADIQDVVHQNDNVAKTFTQRVLNEVMRVRHPCELQRLWWDRVLTVILLYSLMSIPVRACLEISAVPFEWDWCVDGFFLLFHVLLYH